MKKYLFFCLVVFSFFIGIEKASATTYTYTWAGASGASWTTSSNWSCSPSGGSYPGTASTDIVVLNSSNLTINLSSSTALTISCLETNYGVSGVILNLASGSILNITNSTSYTYSGTQPANNYSNSGSHSQNAVFLNQPAGGSPALTVLTFSGSGVTNITGYFTCYYFVNFVISSGARVNFQPNSTLDISHSQGSDTNNGELVFYSGCTFVWSDYTYFTNSGTGSIYSYSSTFNLPGSPCYINNNGTYVDHGSTYSVTGTGAYISNSASSTMLFRGSAITASVGSYKAIQNAGTITADSSATINLTSNLTELYNTGTFYAGLSNSPCVITLSGHQANITNTSVFVLGSTSEISIPFTGSQGASNVQNSGTFTLMSDQYGSASIGQILGTGYSSGAPPLSGTYNVQRYITGDQTTLAYRGYRLLSSPVNLTSGYQGTAGSPNYIGFNTIKNSYTPVTGGTTYYGAFTGGNGSGFSISNSNPTIYLYDETLAPTSSSVNSTFTSGKNVGLNGISGSAVSTTSVFSGATNSSLSVPEGNGFLLYYIGSTNGRSNGSPSLVPDSTTRITYAGNVNSLKVPVVLWYNTPPTAGNLSFTSTLSTSSPGWRGFNMIGNPYPCTIDLQKVYSDNTSFTIFYELVDVIGSYVSYGYNGSTVTMSSPTYSSRYIASGQGFFVVATAVGQSLTFQEDEKVYLPGTLTSPTLASPSANIGVLAKRLQGPSVDNAMSADQPGTKAIINTPANVTAGLHMMLQQNSKTFHECGIYFNNKGSDNFDNNDAIDIDGTAPVLYMSSFTADGIRTGINSLANYTKGKRVKLYVKSTTSGLFSLNLEDIANIDTSAFNIYLVDNKLQDSIDIVRYKTYNFNISTSDTTTFGSDRFVLAIERKPLPPYELVSFTGQKASNGVLLTWKTYNEGDYTGFALQKLEAGGKQYTTLYAVQGNGQGTYTYTDPNPVTGNNMYRLMQNNIDSVITYTNPLNVLYTISTSSGVLSVYPNPAHETITVNFNSATAANGTYQASIYNSLGVLMMQASVSTNTWTQDVSSLKPGAYILKVTASNGTAIGNSKFIKYQ